MSTPISNNHAGEPQESLNPSVRIKQLVGMSHNITVDPHISISKYFKSGRELIKSASACKAKGEEEKAFVLYLRYMTLFIEKLVHHPEYNASDKEEKKLVKDECNRVFDLAEELKKSILAKYEAEYERHNQSGAQSTESLQKRSIGSLATVPHECDLDEIDRKFDFSQGPVSLSEAAFDPFNIEELKRSFAKGN